MTGAPAGRVAVIMPTYNERENLEAMAGRVRAAVPGADLLVVDDNSPDGTGDLADKLAAEDTHIRVLHRPGKGGLGAAYIAGFGWALDQGYDAIVEMDADGSHQPEQLPALLDALDQRRPGARLSLGAGRAGGQLAEVAGGAVPRRQHLRPADAAASRSSDATGGYRVYRAVDAARDRAGRGAVPGLLLPGRPGAPGAAGRADSHRGADHVRGAGARGQQDEPGRSILEAFWRIARWGLAARWKAVSGQRHAASRQPAR